MKEKDQKTEVSEDPSKNKERTESEYTTPPPEGLSEAEGIAWGCDHREEWIMEDESGRWCDGCGMPM